MKPSFGYILSIRPNSRRIVIHHTHLIPNIIDLLTENDIVFFDDCLYSQYIFIKTYYQKLVEKNIICILGFSTHLHRPPEATPIVDIQSKDIHLYCNSICQTILDVIPANNITGGLMSINEIKELIQLDNIYLAIHGACHLNLHELSISKFKKYNLFNKDIADGLYELDQYGLTTNILVCPYEYQCIGLTSIASKYGLTFIFGNGDDRTYIEDLVGKSRNDQIFLT